jgi:mRNA interferase RelE/StbE
LTGGTFELSYHPDVKAVDLPKIDRKNREMIRRAIEKRLPVHPESHGEKLQRTLKDFWKLRVGRFRIIYRMVGNQIRILGIIDRKDV